MQVAGTKLQNKITGGMTFLVSAVQLTNNRQVLAIGGVGWGKVKLICLP